MARVYRHGRRLRPEAIALWRRALEPLVARSGVVVDVGAGTGRFAELFAEWFSPRVVAVEPAAAMRAQAARPGRVLWLGAEAERLPVRGGVADLVWVSDVVHYLDLRSAGREVHRVMRPGGRAIVRSTFPDQFPDTEWMRWFPSARVIDEQRVPTVEAVVDAFGREGLNFESRLVVNQPMAADLREYADLVAARAISTLELIDNEEFEQGLEDLRAAAEAAASPQAVTTPLGLLVFRRSAAA
jgi:SAM-dependent methyltransferase